MQEYLQAWVDVTGRRATFVPTSLEIYEGIWGPFGREVGLMLRAFEGVGDWTGPYGGCEVVTAGDLGIVEGELVGLREALEGERGLL